MNGHTRRKVFSEMHIHRGKVASVVAADTYDFCDPAVGIEPKINWCLVHIRVTASIECKYLKRNRFNLNYFSKQRLKRLNCWPACLQSLDEINMILRTVPAYLNRLYRQYLDPSVQGIPYAAKPRNLLRRGRQLLGMGSEAGYSRLGQTTRKGTTSKRHRDDLPRGGLSQIR